MYIEVIKPKGENLNVVKIQKPLLDGIISAFHKVSFDDISNLINNNVSCLSSRAVIQKYRNGIKWNPQDEKCVDCRIVLKESEDDGYKMSGYIFAK